MIAVTRFITHKSQSHHAVAAFGKLNLAQIRSAKRIGCEWLLKAYKFHLIHFCNLINFEYFAK